MKINRNNFEQYLIDYLDGKLNPDQEKILLSFLEFNPDLKDEFEGLERAYLLPSDHTYHHKNDLIKVVEPFEELCIDSVEQQLDADKEKHLRALVSEDSGREITYKLYRSTVLTPDKNIRYPGKSGLIKLTLRKAALRILLPVAAAAAVLIGALLIFNQDGTLPFNPGISGTQIQDQPVLLENEAVQEITTIARTSTSSGKRTRRAAIPDDVEKESQVPGDPIRIARVQPLGITQIMAVSGIPSYALMHKLQEDPGRLEQFAIDKVESGLLATGQLPEKARNALWRLADAGVRGLNRISEEEIELSREIDNNGNTRGFKFESAIFGISSPIPKTNLR